MWNETRESIHLPKREITRFIGSTLLYASSAKGSTALHMQCIKIHNAIIHAVGLIKNLFSRVHVGLCLARIISNTGIKNTLIQRLPMRCGADIERSRKRTDSLPLLLYWCIVLLLLQSVDLDKGLLAFPSADSFLRSLLSLAACLVHGLCR